MEDIKIHKLSNEEQQELKKCLLEIYRDVALVCQKYNLNLMLGGGTCLGAVRHQGFIPWDDDIDLNLFRKDYNKLQEIFNKELSDKYFLVEPKMTQTGQRLFAKIIKKNTTFIEMETSILNSANGIFVDIFPIESLPDNKLVRALFLYWANIFTKAITIISEYQLNRRFIKRRHHKIIGKLTSFMSFNKWYLFYDAFISSSKGTQYCTIPSGRKGVYGEMQPLDTFMPLVKGIFEGMETSIPNNYDKYLANLYGDYMNLPPLEQRHTLHKIIKFSLNKSYT
jgi:lipopolysaccharide cholinephosphotransferase